jgi:hypothetical protein
MEAKTKIVELTLTVKQTWVCRIDDTDTPRRLMEDYFGRVHNGQGEGTLAEDYGRDAWGGYDGPILMSSEVV